MNRKQLTLFFSLLLIYILCIFLSYALFMDQLTAMVQAPLPDTGLSNPMIGLVNAGIGFLLYGLVGLLGYWFARKLALPGIIAEHGTWSSWLLRPAALGIICGIALLIGDLLFAPMNGLGRFPHPPFPLSILASLSAGIGEEILFRGFVFGLWGFLLKLALRRFVARNTILWLANLIAALAFGAGHLGTVMLLTKANALTDLSTILLVEVFLLNGIVALVAGKVYMKAGLVGAIGVHFWADIIWHVLWGLTA